MVCTVANMEELEKEELCGNVHIISYGHRSDSTKDLPADVDSGGGCGESYFSSLFSNLFSAEEPKDEVVEEELRCMVQLLKRTIWNTLGIVGLVIAASKYTAYVSTLHENRLWFSNLKETERELSFEGESVFFYSFYKELVGLNFTEGCTLVSADNKSEHGRTVNAFHKYNIFPEVFLSGLYKLVNLRISTSVFYIKCVFILHGVYIGTLYALSWHLSGSFLGGVTCTVLFVLHRIDGTRVDWNVPLRENFGVPFLFIRLLTISLYIKSSRFKVVKMLCIVSMSIIFLFCWQFAPYAIFCEIFVIFGLQILEVMCSSKARLLTGGLLVAHLVALVSQSFHPKLLASPVLPAGALSLCWPRALYCRMQCTHFLLSIAKALMCACSYLVMVTGITWCFKTCLISGDYSYLGKLILGRFFPGHSRDFETNLYRCDHVNFSLSSDTLWRFTETGLLPIFLVSLLFHGVLAWRAHVGSCFRTCGDDDEVNFSKSQSQELSTSCNPSGMEKDQLGKEALHIAYSSSAFLHGLAVLFFGAMLLDYHLRVVWVPLGCVLCGSFLSGTHFFSVVASSGKETGNKLCSPPLVKGIVCLLYISIICLGLQDEVRGELQPQDLHDFHDPSAVDLMEWVKVSSRVDATFAGTVQLMAQVKACTRRPVISHPLFQDQWLINRTKQVYQMYGRRRIEEVYSSLRAMDVDYIIIENSVCSPPAENDQGTNTPVRLCRHVDVIDLDNGHIPGLGPVPGLSHLVAPQVERFCHVSVLGSPLGRNHFRPVLENAAFRVYQVL